MITKTKELSRVPNSIFSFNGLNLGEQRFMAHIPWSGDNKWYWFTGTTSQVAQSPPNITAVGDISRLSVYKSSAEQNTAMTVNSTKYLSTHHHRARDTI
jgi:hypothetical protein